MSNLSNRLTALKAKTTDLVITEVKQPISSADTLTLFKANSSAKSASANEWIIDLFPDQTPTMSYIFGLATKYSQAIDHKEHAKSSTATVTLYLMAIYNAYFLINDMFVRPTPSAHAQTWHQITWKKEFVNFLMTLPVPEELETIFAQLAATESERTRNVFLVPSAAGFQHDHFLGRFFPLSIFTHMHDCIATIPGNSSRMTIMNDLLSRELYRLKTTAKPNHTYVAYLADFLGITVSSATSSGTTTHTGHSLATKFYQMFSSTFNPVLFRDFHRRSSLTSINLAVPTFKTQYPSYYDLAFNATAMNLAELKVVLQSMSSLLTGHVNMKKNLVQIISSASGISAFQHGYSTFPLPLWSSNNDLQDATTNVKTFPTLTHLKDQQPYTRASQISFLQPNTTTTPSTTIFDAKDSKHANDSTITRKWPFSLITTDSNAAGTVHPKDNEFVIMNEDNEKDHTYPRVLVLDIENDATISAHLATLTGKIIYSFEIDGCTIEHPNTNKSLGLQNCLFADSAIPYKYCRRATRFYNRTAGSIAPPLARAKAISTRRLPASTLLHDRTTIRLPSLQLQIVDSAVPDTLPGFTKANNWQWISAVQSFLGFRTVINDNDDALDSVPDMEKGRLYVWSPYTYTPYEESDSDTGIPNNAESRHYFLTNLRSLFGTDFNLVELVHPLEALPVL